MEAPERGLSQHTKPKYYCHSECSFVENLFFVTKQNEESFYIRGKGVRNRKMK